MRRVFRFLTNMDAKAWRALAVSFLLFGGVGVVFLFGASLLGLSGPGEVQAWMAAGARGPWALPMAVGAFAGLAFLGVPQFVLIAAAVVAFGPWTGFAYSWIGTMVSSAIGFFLGRRFGAGLLKSYAGKGVNAFIEMVGKNGFLASLVVRLVPSAPFIVVNMAAGVTPMSFWSFAAGTGIGIIPKTGLTAFAGAAAVKGMTGGGSGHWWTIAAVAVIWIGSALLAREWLKRREAKAAALKPPEIAP
ncbi:TVP38/TMEM64 family protein [soil metagenome]